MKKYKGIIFDLDGVICSTDEYHYQAWKALADRLGVFFDRECNKKIRGVSRMDSLEVILGKSGTAYTKKEKEAFAEEKNNIYRSLLAGLSPADLSENVRETLLMLKERGYLLAVGSSSRNTCYILERLGLDRFFDAVADGSCITRAKPDPEVFLKAAEMIGCSPGECLVVEDAYAGLQAAVAGGFDCAVIGELRDDTLAVQHLDKLSDLLQYHNDQLSL